MYDAQSLKFHVRRSVSSFVTHVQKYLPYLEDGLLWAIPQLRMANMTNAVETPT